MLCLPVLCARGSLLQRWPHRTKGRNPDFGAGTGWDMIASTATDYVDPASIPKNITNDPKYPLIGNQPGQKTDRVADLTS